MKNDWKDVCIRLDQATLTIRKPAIIAPVYILSIFEIGSFRDDFFPSSVTLWLAVRLRFNASPVAGRYLSTQPLDLTLFNLFNPNLAMQNDSCPLVFIRGSFRPLLSYLIIIRYVSHNVTTKNGRNSLLTRSSHRIFRSSPKNDFHITLDHGFAPDSCLLVFIRGFFLPKSHRKTENCFPPKRNSVRSPATHFAATGPAERLAIK
jgi:hypothetical protein